MASSIKSEPGAFIKIETDQWPGIKIEPRSCLKSEIKAEKQGPNIKSECECKKIEEKLPTLKSNIGLLKQKLNKSMEHPNEWYGHGQDTCIPANYWNPQYVNYGSRADTEQSRAVHDTGARADYYYSQLGNYRSQAGVAQSSGWNVSETGVHANYWNSLPGNYMCNRVPRTNASICLPNRPPKNFNPPEWNELPPPPVAFGLQKFGEKELTVRLSKLFPMKMSQKTTQFIVDLHVENPEDITRHEFELIFEELSEWAKKFQLIDQNRDGAISPDDLIQAIPSFGFGIPENKLKSMMNSWKGSINLQTFFQICLRMKIMEVLDEKRRRRSPFRGQGLGEQEIEIESSSPDPGPKMKNGDCRCKCSNLFQLYEGLRKDVDLIKSELGNRL